MSQNNNVPETPEQQAPTPTRRPRQIPMTPPPNYSGPSTDGVTTFVISSSDGGTMTTRRRRRRRRPTRPQRRSTPDPVLPIWFTALKTALMKRNADHVITILAQSGSDLLRQEINGKSLLDIMATNGDFLVARILLERGILHKSAVVKMIKKYLTMDITQDKLKHLFELFDSLDNIGEDDTYHILSDRLPKMMFELFEKLQMDEFDREVLLDTPLKDNVKALIILIQTRIRDIDMSVRKRMLEMLAGNFEYEIPDNLDVQDEIDTLKSLLHTKYNIGTLYKLEEFALIDFDDKSNRILQFKDPAKDATTNCSFMGNKGDREGPVKILVETTNPTIPVGEVIIDDRTKDRYRILYKGPKIDVNTEVIVTYRKNMSTYRQKAIVFNYGEVTFNSTEEMKAINVILEKNVTPIEFTVMSKPEWATEDGKILHVFCGKDMQKYLETNDRSPFDRRKIVGVQFLTTKEIIKQERLLMRQMQSKVNNNLLKTPPLKSRASPKDPPPLDPVDVLQKRLNTSVDILQKRLNTKFTMQDSVLLQRIKNMRNLLKNPKLSKENEELYKQKLEEYMEQISDPQDALIKRKEKERDNLLIQQMETREKIQQYQAGRLRWTDEQAEYYQDLMNSFPRMIERLDNEIENMKNSRDGASKLKKPRLKKLKF